jgi:hypothetical protein
LEKYDQAVQAACFGQMDEEGVDEGGLGMAREIVPIQV